MKQRWALFSAVCLALTLAFCLAWPNPGGAAVRAQSEASDWWVELHPASSTNRGQYQGYLQTGGLPAGGSYDLQFTLYDAASGGVPLGEAISYENLQVSEGLFNVTLDWDGLGSSPAWVEVSLRLADDSAAESFTTLARRLPLSGAAGSSAPPTSTTALQPGAMLAPGDFTLKAASPVPLTCVTSDPNTGLVYAQADRGLGFYVYDPAADSWSTLAPSPLNSGNNGGAAYLGGKIYTVYTENSTSMGVYDIATDTWATIPNGLGVGTGVIASDGSYLYLAVGSTFKRYNPISATWADRAAPSIDIQPWGGMAYWNGRLYAHRGNGLTEFARYDIASNTWTTLPSLPDGAVLGSAIDPVRREYYAYGSYGGTNWYIFDLDAESWRVETIPFFSVNDGGMAYAVRGHASGVYFVQGEDGAGFGRYQDASPSNGLFAINDNAAYVNSTSVTINVYAEDPETGVSHMRFRNETPWRALLFQDAYPWDTDALQRVLDGYSLPYDLLPSSVMATSDLASYSQVIIPSDQPQDLYDAYDAERTRFEDYASNGGLVQFHAAAWGWHPGNLSGIPLPGGVSISQQYSEWNFITEPAHPLVAGIANPLRGIFASHATFSGLLDGNQTISTAGDAPGGNPTLIEYPLGDGKVIASGQTLEYGWHNNQAAWRILENMIPYAAGDMPWSASVPWTLEPGDGVKTVYAQFRNGAGLYSTVTTDTIILDTQPPVASATCMIGTSQTSIEVSWSGSDSLSGVSNYDVQYRVGAAGAWTDWPGLAATTLTSATFGPLSPLPVEHLQSYSFRVRAHDNAGNASAYAAAGDCSVSIEPASLYLPSLIR
jgi:hypothetical protein